MGDIGPVATQSPLAYPGYVANGAGVTPYPLVCATWRVPLPRSDVSVAITTAGPATSVSLHVGQTLLVSGRETCDFEWNFASTNASDPNILSVLQRSDPPSGVQGTAWVQFSAVARGATRVGVSGGCAVPDPPPSEPAGIPYVCTTEVVVALLNVSVT